MKNPTSVAMCHIPVGFSVCFLSESVDSVAFSHCQDAWKRLQEAFADIFLFYLVDAGSALHASHGDEQPFQPWVSVGIVGREEMFVTAQPAEQKHGADVVFGVVAVFRRGPPADDGSHGKGFSFRAEPLVVSL